MNNHRNKRVFYRNTKALTHYKQKIHNSKQSIKTTHKSIGTILNASVKSTVDQLDEGKELTDSATIAYGVTKPVTSKLKKTKEIAKSKQIKNIINKLQTPTLSLIQRQLPQNHHLTTKIAKPQTTPQRRNPPIQLRTKCSLLFYQS